MTLICQVVLFSFKPDVSEEDLAELWSKMASLREDCLKPNETKPYIRSMRFGIDHAKFKLDVRQTLPPKPKATWNAVARLTLIKSIQETITHALITEFENEEDRRYFMDHDPAHLSISALGKKVFSQLHVLAYVPGSGIGTR
ncbi:hypothetical protein PT974_03904 [Cladobotryum mycophilum]|uniref:Stress-response A/B barrel domain-containing protein n=1 Tax=Cladobotryum mycophilum TaxID=491253 RepID=A0ABR0SUS9_9HYPO